ncbi:MAG: FtsW/RodA/SpoVE family cell cycle protein [Rikenellaceae bacterium]
MAITKEKMQEYIPSTSWFAGDRALWVIIAVLSIISVLVVYSSSAKMAYDNAAIKSTTQFLQNQITALILGWGAMFIVNRINSRDLLKITPIAYGVTIGLTMLVYVLGQSTNGAARWISIAGFQFQPSEALKITTTMYLARQLAIRQDIIDKIKIIPSFNVTTWSSPEQQRIFKEGFFPLLFPMLLSCCVIVPAHTSSAVLLFGVSMVVLMVGRVNFRELAKIVVIVFCGALSLFMLGAGRADTAGGRFSTWVETWTTDRSDVASEDLSDTERSMIAMYNGGLTGVGAGHSAMRVEMIHPESDYAYAFFVEEYGSLLGVLLLVLYLWIFFRAITIFEECGTTFPALMVLGLAMMITCQALLHVAVTINILPETGQTLPLISRGGSALIFNATALGMILSVSRQNMEHSHDAPKSQSMYEK